MAPTTFSPQQQPELRPQSPANLAWHEWPEETDPPDPKVAGRPPQELDFLSDPTQEPYKGAETKHKWRKILFDIDDTLYSSNGVFPAGCDKRYPRHVLHVFDSFEGLPPPSAHDRGTFLRRGGLNSSIGDYLRRFRSARLDPPYIHQGFFGEIPESEYPPSIAFAFFDGDFYSSIRDSFARVWPKMAHGGTIVVDDYLYPTLEGVKEAVDDFLRDKPAARLPVPLNVSYKRRRIPSSIPFQDYEGVIAVP